MSFVAATIYWVIVALWLAVLGTVCISYLRNRQVFGSARLLLSVVAIDTLRNIIENVYFGLYFGAQYGLFPGAIVGALGKPQLLIIPKLINVVAASAVLGLLILRWLPAAIKEHKETGEHVRDAERRFRLLVDGVTDYAIYMLDPEGCVTSWNSGAQRIKGYTADEIIGANFARFYTAEDQAAGAPREALNLAASNGSFETKAWRVRKDGSRFWANVVIDAIHDDAGNLVGFAKVTKDITEGRLYEERLTHLAHFDQLTGLPNRIKLRADLDKLFNSSPSRSVAIALFDLDGFKEINDTLGHTVGDRLLAEVARRMKDAASGGGSVYRLGDDEFVLVSWNCQDPSAIAALVELLSRSVAANIDMEGHRLHVGVSAGIAIAPNHASDPDGLIANADLALRDAKVAGGRSWRMFIPQMRARAQAHQLMDGELRRASAEGEFLLFYQPQIRLSDGAVVGAEALLRWQHPSRGLLEPAAFIEALVKSPAAAEAGDWILRTACDTAASWRAKDLPPIRIGVNLFPTQFHDGMLTRQVEDALHRSGLPPGALELEITENIVLNRDDHVIAALRALRAKGVGLAFDDFGTGYASLSFLMRFPVTRIKIDRSFVRKIGPDCTSEDSAIVRSMIVMGHNLGLEVIAEGIETAEQEAYLRSSRCDEAQGYLYAKPLPAGEFENFLRFHPRSALHRGKSVPADPASAA
jgi:diguanylate cyclase (GGDEF)-like protein/PAS domain S-box-containing protein